MRQRDAAIDKVRVILDSPMKIKHSDELLKEDPNVDIDFNSTVQTMNNFQSMVDDHLEVGVVGISAEARKSDINKIRKNPLRHQI